MELGLPVWSPQIGTREMGLCTSGRGLRTLYYTVVARSGEGGFCSIDITLPYSHSPLESITHPGQTSMIL